MAGRIIENWQRFARISKSSGMSLEETIQELTEHYERRMEDGLPDSKRKEITEEITKEWSTSSILHQGKRTTKFSETKIVQIAFIEKSIAHKFMVETKPPFGLPESLPSEMFLTDIPYPLEDRTN